MTRLPAIADTGSSIDLPGWAWVVLGIAALVWVAVLEWSRDVRNHRRRHVHYFRIDGDGLFSCAERTCTARRDRHGGVA